MCAFSFSLHCPFQGRRREISMFKIPATASCPLPTVHTSFARLKISPVQGLSESAGNPSMLSSWGRFLSTGKELGFAAAEAGSRKVTLCRMTCGSRALSCSPSAAGPRAPASCSGSGAQRSSPRCRRGSRRCGRGAEMS